MLFSNAVLYGALIGGAIGLCYSLGLIFFMKYRSGKVPRFSQFVPFAGDFAGMSATIENCLAVQGFFPVSYKNENGVYRKGNGFWTSCKFIKMTAMQDGYQIEAFVSVYGTESGLDGFTAKLPKQSCKGTVDLIINTIQAG